ncbi:MAG: GAF domain-containing protein [Jatrophihabitans sp.]|uniref:GAF domain-containing protein n=1 Tax=Jatrophihabitans sp. TaxID=1932789 RepID=UPI003F7ECBFA
MTSPGIPGHDDIAFLITAMRDGRERLLALADAVPGLDTDDLVRTIDEVGQTILVADEEMRVQKEQIGQAGRRLDLLVALHEELFHNAPVAYLQTDDVGLVLRFNAAARRLLDLDPAPGRPVTIVSLVRPEDRAAVRAVITRLRAASGEQPGGRTPPIEVMLRRGDGRDVPAVLTARPTVDGGATRTLLHWELRAEPGPAAAAPMLQEPVDVGSPAQALQAVAAAAARLNEQPTAADLLDEVVRQTAVVVPHGEHVALTITRGRGRHETPAATSDLAAACDRLQTRLHEGPCREAVSTGKPVVIGDLVGDHRWPRFASQVTRLGVRSMLVLPLTASRGTVGALTLSSARPGAFGDAEMALASVWATHAAIAMLHAELVENLRIGLQSRQEIGQGVGILMERHRVSAEAAFDRLVQASQDTHVKVRDIAARLVETGEDPATYGPDSFH